MFQLRWPLSFTAISMTRSSSKSQTERFHYVLLCLYTGSPNSKPLTGLCLHFKQRRGHHWPAPGASALPAHSPGVEASLRMPVHQPAQQLHHEHYSLHRWLRSLFLRHHGLCERGPGVLHTPVPLLHYDEPLPLLLAPPLLGPNIRVPCRMVS